MRGYSKAVAGGRDAEFPDRREAAHPGPNDANSDSIFAVVGWVALGVLGSG
jgi:hypothetical protein